MDGIGGECVAAWRGCRELGRAGPATLEPLPEHGQHVSISSVGGSEPVVVLIVAQLLPPRVCVEEQRPAVYPIDDIYRSGTGGDGQQPVGVSVLDEELPGLWCALEVQVDATIQAGADSAVDDGDVRMRGLDDEQLITRQRHSDEVAWASSAANASSGALCSRYTTSRACYGDANEPPPTGSATVAIAMSNEATPFGMEDTSWRLY